MSNNRANNLTRKPNEDKESSLASILKSATTNLLYPSESDFAVEPILLHDSFESLTDSFLIALSEKKSDATVETFELDYFFEPVIDDKGFKKLAKVLKKNLKEIKVYRVGDFDADIFILGKTSDGLIAGVRTEVVET